MALNIATITPAVLKAKEVATEAYVDTAVSNMTISDAIWQAKVQEAVNNDMTTINGSHIITGTIGADQIAANSIMANMINADAINGKVIKGSIIEGASITGSVIKSSWIDYSSTGHLTNWKYFTNATIPEAYRGNFAFDNYGNIIIDSEGYVRLQGTTELYSATKSAIQYEGGTLTLVGSDEVYPYDSYTINTARRCISIRPRLVTTSEFMIGEFPSTGNMSFTLGSYNISIYDPGNNFLNVYANGVLIDTVGWWSWTLPYGIKMKAVGFMPSYGLYRGVYRWSVYLLAQSTLFTEDFTGSSPFLRNLTANAPVSGGYISLEIPQYALN